MSRKVLIGIIAAVFIAIAAIAASGGSSTQPEFDRTGKSVDADAPTLLPSFSVMPDGWMNGGTNSVSGEPNVTSASNIAFVTGDSRTITVTIYVFDTVENAKSRYQTEKASAESTYKIAERSEFEDCYKYSFSSGLAHFEQYNFRDMNVYCEIFSSSGFVHIEGRVFDSIMGTYRAR